VSGAAKAVFSFITDQPGRLNRLGGAVVFVVGIGWMIFFRQPFGLVVFLVGADVVARPMARRIPKAGALTAAVLAVVELVLRTKRGP
jgi:hypothetical protein